MWTPKRILLLVLGAVTFLAAYVVYSVVPGLGSITGMPPLPQAYYPDAQPDDPGIDRDRVPPPPPERMLRLAFGEDCRELRWPIKLYSKAKGMALACQQFEIQKEDGKVRLEPMSLALFGKTEIPGKVPEINTIRCEKALLTFDKPISNITEMNTRRIVEALLEGKGKFVELVNNRHTVQRDDDLSLFTKGPVIYLESKNLIFTDNVVEVLDMQSKPEPTKVEATGMDIYLTPRTTATAQAAPKPSKSKAGPLGDVERVVLRSGVEMHLWVDARSGFMTAGKPEPDPKVLLKPAEGAVRPPMPGSGQVATLSPENGKTQGAPAAKPAPPPEKSHVIITTHGPFTYNVLTDHARFDIPEKKGGVIPERVLLTRVHEPASAGRNDVLDCEHLEIQFKRKDTKQGPPSADPTGDLEIQTVHATAEDLVLTSDAETLEAHGNELHYDAVTRLTTLKGEKGMWALKEGDEIHARELRILELKVGKQVTGIGPGQMDLLDKNTGKRTRHARWNDLLVSGKEDGFDLITFTGNAALTDDDPKQELHGDSIKIWLESQDPARPSTGGPVEERGRKPHHLEALGRVMARSSEMYVHDTHQLILRFMNTPPEKKLATSAPAVPAPAAPAPAVAGPAVPAAPPGQPAPGASAAQQPPNPAQKPVDLSAHIVEAWVAEEEGKNDIKRVRAEGNVRVIQEPATPEDKGVDIKGATLNLNHTNDGNILVVTGDLAQLQMNQIFIMGPEVNIDQVQNKAWVNGVGAMQLESESDFEGRKLQRKVPLKIYWNEDMLFTGKFAYFNGGIQAEQEEARLKCKNLQVVFDRPISLKERTTPAATSKQAKPGDKAGPARPGDPPAEPPAKVQQLICDQDVHVEETKRDEKGRFLRYTRIEAGELTVDNLLGITDAPGPGIVRIWQPGGAQQGPGGTTGTPKPPSASGPETFNLTKVMFEGHMTAKQKENLATFLGGVQVIYGPATSPDTVIDVTKLPPGGMHLRSKRLQVYSRTDEPNQRNQWLEATGEAKVKGPDYYGDADQIKYEEAADKITLIGSKGAPANLVRMLIRGDKPDEFSADKIIYIRRTGAVEIEHIYRIDSRPTPANPARPAPGTKGTGNSR
jgi:lipopolysaccharide export system protein LptA